MQNGAICLQYSEKELDISGDTFFPRNFSPQLSITSEHQMTTPWQISSDLRFKITQCEDGVRGSMQCHWCLLPRDAAGNGDDVGSFEQAQGQAARGTTAIILLQSKEL